MNLQSLGVFCLMVGSVVADDAVEPSELDKRQDLVGREVVVDDRIRYFLQSKPRQGYDELLLRRTEVLFRLPARLKSARSPTEPNVRIRGLLKVVDGRLVCDVDSLELLPADSDRLDRELKRLRPDDLEGRRSWALWAERRGNELTDPKLESRGQAIEAETLWAEAERPQADALALVERSTNRPIPAPLRNALAHRGFRSLLARTTDPSDLEGIARKVEATLPESRNAGADRSPGPDLREAYRLDPASAYRRADDRSRAGLDRQLLADIVQKQLERQVEARPNDAPSLADAARARLPDRPGVADRLRRSGLADSESRAASMRQSEVEQLATAFRGQGEDDRANRLLRGWLDDRRKHRLSGTDAEGRVLLAANYDRMISDKAAAAELLNEALAIEPESKGVAEAFLRMGYRKGDQGWYDPSPARAGATAKADPGRVEDPSGSTAQAGADPLKGLTREQVRSRLGSKPDRVIRIATQGRCLEQWLFRSGKRSQIINFFIEPGTIEPRVSSYYLD